jgi:hypothetical protein
VLVIPETAQRLSGIHNRCRCRIYTDCVYGSRAPRWLGPGMTLRAADIHSIALYIPLARPRPGFWRWRTHDPEKRKSVFRKDRAPKMDLEK